MLKKNQIDYSVLARYLLFENKTVDILQEFESAGISVIILKGMILATTVYDSPAQRDMNDVDLLVKRRDLSLVHKLLLNKGFDFSSGAECSLVFAREFKGQIPYFDGSLLIDLHWHLVGPHWYRFTTDFDLEGIWSRSVPTQMGDAPVRRLCTEDEIIHLCYHTAVHHGLFHRQGYGDIIRLVRSEAATLDWMALAQRARAWKVSVAVWATLNVARRLDAEIVPDAALQALQVSRWRQRVLDRFVERAVIGRPQLVSGNMRFFGVLLVDRFQDLPRVVWRGLFPGRNWIQSRFNLSRRQARWRQVTYPLEVLWRALGVLFARERHREVT